MSWKDVAKVASETYQQAALAAANKQVPATSFTQGNSGSSFVSGTNTPKDITDIVNERAGLTGQVATLPLGTAYIPTDIATQEEEFVATPGALGDVSVTTYTAPETGLDTSMPRQGAVPTATTVTTEAGVGDARFAVGEVDPQAVVGNIQGQVSQESIAKAATGDLDYRATTQYQLSELYKSLENGEQLPPWASPAARAANAVMATRGLGSSSVAAAATVQALMESALPIANADAQRYATIQIQNLNSEQQAALQNAATFAAMDRANLDARMTGAVTNARAFLEMDLANLSAEQQSNTLTYNAKTQALFTDAAAENATQQFNAKNQIQVDQFFAELSTQVENANKNRMAAMQQFNVDQKNAMEQFVVNANNQREQFDINMQAQIDQSNAAWRRETNLANTAAENEANRINAQNILGLTTSAQNALWQKYRDEMAWAFQVAENDAQRAHAVGMASMNNNFNKDAYNTELRDSLGVQLGKAALNWVFG